MSDENVKIVSRIYDSFNRGNITQALDAFDADVKWSITPEAGPAPRSYRGHTGVREALDSLFDVWRDYQSEPIEFMDRGEFIVVRICTQGTGRASGAEVEDEVAHVWKIRNRRVVSFEAHLDTVHALETVTSETGG